MISEQVNIHSSLDFGPSIGKFQWLDELHGSQHPSSEFQGSSRHCTPCVSVKGWLPRKHYFVVGF